MKEGKGKGERGEKGRNYGGDERQQELEESANGLSHVDVFVADKVEHFVEQLCQRGAEGLRMQREEVLNAQHGLC
jgi:hypothetical protein